MALVKYSVTLKVRGVGSVHCDPKARDRRATRVQTVRIRRCPRPRAISCYPLALDSTGYVVWGGGSVVIDASNIIATPNQALADHFTRTATWGTRSFRYDNAHSRTTVSNLHVSADVGIGSPSDWCAADHEAEVRRAAVTGANRLTTRARQAGDFPVVSDSPLRKPVRTVVPVGWGGAACR